MNIKKKKNPAADDLIESLMNDLKLNDQSASKENSEGKDFFSKEDESFNGIAIGNEDSDRLEATNIVVGNLWSNLEKEALAKPSLNNEEYFDSPLLHENLENLENSEHIEFENELDLQAVEGGAYKGPSAGDGGYQTPDELLAPPPPQMFQAGDDSTKQLFDHKNFNQDDKTVSIQNDSQQPSKVNTDDQPLNDYEKTLAVEGFANVKLGARKNVDPDVRVSIGQLRGSSTSRHSSSVFTSIDASLAQSENLKLAQQRILDLEKECEKLRAENEELASAGDIIRTRTDEYSIQINSLKKEKSEIEESHQSEVLILKGNLQYKETEVAKARIKIEELEARLKADFKKIRVKERELENRLELVRAEKTALVRSKDEYILDMKRKIDQLQSELDNYRGKVLELNKTIDSNQEQFKRTVRALRLALSNLEVKEENLVPFKKVE